MRSTDDADALVAAGVHVSLVKGAYVEATGAHPYGEETDIASLRLAFRLVAAQTRRGRWQPTTAASERPSCLLSGMSRGAAPRRSSRRARRAALVGSSHTGLRSLRSGLVPLLAPPGPNPAAPDVPVLLRSGKTVGRSRNRSDLTELAGWETRSSV